jgi:hypothetical protein
VKMNAFSRRKPATKSQLGRKKVKQKANEREQSVRESLLRSRDSVRSETENAPGRGKQAEERRERLTGRKGGQAAKQFAFSLRKSATKPSFSRQLNRERVRASNE